MTWHKQASRAKSRHAPRRLVARLCAGAILCPSGVAPALVALVRCPAGWHPAEADGGQGGPGTREEQLQAGEAGWRSGGAPAGASSSPPLSFLSLLLPALLTCFFYATVCLSHMLRSFCSCGYDGRAIHSAWLAVQTAGQLFSAHAGVAGCASAAVPLQHLVVMPLHAWRLAPPPPADPDVWVGRH